MQPSSRHQLEGHLAMLIFSLFVAGSFSFGDLIANEVDPVVLTAGRFALVTIILGTVLAAMGKFRRKHYIRPWRFVVLGTLFLLHFVLMFEALQLTSAVTTSAIFTTMPLAAAAIDRILFRSKNSTMIWVALLIGASGALWVVFRGSWVLLFGFSLGLGELIFFVATLSHATYAVLIPRLRGEEPIYATTFGVALAATVLLLIWSWPRLANVAWTEFSYQVWIVLAYLAIFATLGTFVLITIATSRLSSAKVTAYTYLTPFWVVILQGALGIGVPSPFILLGGIPIAIALMLLMFESSRKFGAN